MKKLGILALQGDVPEHRAALEVLLDPSQLRLVRKPAELQELDGLILPGGESTTIGRLLDAAGLTEPLVRRAREGLPILATCAGLILVAKQLEASDGGRDPTPLGLLDVTVRRNDYGRQAESFEGAVEVEGLSGGPFPGVFIRAPRIHALGPSASVIARRGPEIVGARSGAVWGLCFHPELSRDPRVLELFLRRSGILAEASRSRRGGSATGPRGARRK